MESMTVLCAAHCPSPLHTLCRMLEGAGYDVMPASSGREAISLFASRPVHSVLVEYDLPDKKGFCVREEMKRINPDIPILLFSGAGSQTPILLRFFNAYMRQTADETDS